MKVLPKVMFELGTVLVMMVAVEVGKTVELILRKLVVL